MDCPKRAVLFMEETVSQETRKPLMLEALLSCSILKWMSDQLLADGVQRFFIACDDAFVDEVRSCFPEGVQVTASPLQKDLMEFLDTPDPVLVLPRSAVPMKEAGPGFVYAAPGCELRDIWREKMTNAITGAELVPGWLPVYGPETIAELEPLLRQRAENT
jgi:bifunctional UDP-N-acetylglucosamine pyrophosphorylase/glucosamine-1-phosphate N-acetyltransferase